MRKIECKELLIHHQSIKSRNIKVIQNIGCSSNVINCITTNTIHGGNVREGRR